MNQHLPAVELVGRSSSHFTRLARIFALELGVPHVFRPVLDIASLDAVSYADNPALKLPILVDERGPLFGSENICHALLRRSGRPRASVVMRGDVDDRLVANAEELTLHVMSAEVSLIMAQLAGDGHRPPPKVAQSLQHSLRYLDERLDAVQAALPPSRAFSFVEVALYCVTTHLTFRQVVDVTSFTRLGDFCADFAQRSSARATEYRFDAA